MILTKTAQVQKKLHQLGIPKLLLLPILLLLGTPLVAFQLDEIPALKSTWKDKTLHDTIRMRALVLLCTEPDYMAVHSDSAIYYAKQGYAFAQQHHYPEYVAHFLDAQGQIFDESSDYYRAEGFHRRALHIADSLNERKLIIKCLSNLGHIHLNRSDHANAISYFLRALSLTKPSESAYKQVILANLGTSYLELNDGEKALLYYNESMDLYTKDRDTAGISLSLNNLSIIYINQKNYPKALEALTRGLQLAKASNTRWLQAALYMKIGDVYKQLGEPDLAMDNFQQARRQSLLINDKIGNAETLFRLALLYQNQRPDSTIILARQALAIAQKADKKNILVNISNLLYETYEAQGQYQSALEMYKLYSNTQDSIFNDQQQQSIFRSEAKYEYEKKQLEDKIRFEQQLAQTQLTQQRRYYLLITLILALLLGGYILFRYRGLKFQEERAELLLKISNLRQTVTQNAFAASGLPQKSILNKTKIEEFVGGKLGETSWNILQLLIEKPTISNREIAEALFLSEEGVSSSLRRMYSAFDIQSGNSKNHKIALLSKVAELSIER